MSEKQRKLTKAEERRKVAFEELKIKMQEQGYETAELKMGILEVNVLSLVTAIPFIIAVVIPYVILHGNPFYQNYSRLIFILAILAGIVIHELLHGLTWVFVTEGGWKSVSFGFNVKYCAPYCTCSEPMKKAPMILAAIMPTVMLGFIPAVIGIILGGALIFLLGVVMIVGGCGDMLIILKILRYRSGAGEVLFLDHPYEIGTVIFEK